MSWLDGVLAVPTIGVHTKIEYDSVMNFEGNVGKFAYKLENSGEKFRIERKELWGYEITCDSGYAFLINRNNFVASFKYLFIEKDQPGALPHMEVPQVLSYTEICSQIEDYIDNLFVAFNNIPEMVYDRIGIVTSANLEKTTTPPGVKKWLEYLGRPWAGDLVDINAKICTNLSNDGDYADRCHHSIEYASEKVEETGFRIILDWQRKFNKKQSISVGNFKDRIGVCKNKAFEYFEKFAQGDLEYE